MSPADTPANQGPEAAVSPGQPVSSRFTISEVGREIAGITLNHPTRLRWAIGFGICSGLVVLWLVSIVVLLSRGVGVWGINIPVGWGLAITNVVWWIGIGHAGTLISTLLLMTGAAWRTSLNRFAEAMTLFAVICAATYPVLHLGRPHLLFWLIPHPNQLGLGPQYRSPLEWDIFAITSYALVSLMFWYVGMLPDLALLRDRARDRFGQVLYGVLAMGWKGSTTSWTRWRRSYLILAGFALPLVVSVHSGVSMLLAGGPIPGWHTTIFPPYFVLGAVFSGFAVVAILAVLLRSGFRLQHLINDRHLSMIAVMLLVSGLMTSYGYVLELWGAWYSSDSFERNTAVDRLFGPWAWAYWGAIVLNFASIQLFWFPRFRRSPLVLFLVGLAVSAGMWCERYMLVVSALARDYLPSSFGDYWPSFWEWTLFLGSIGLFGWLFFLFIRFLPMISIFEIKEVVHHPDDPVERGEPEGPR
ncbi:MAG: NrfD/PsrC family molybdoenzyme membrane anchor subunit [Oceanicaulis sp.]